MQGALLRTEGLMTVTRQFVSDTSLLNLRTINLALFSDVFNNNDIVAASDAFSNVTGETFLGRPWSDFARYRILSLSIELLLTWVSAELSF